MGKRASMLGVYWLIFISCTMAKQVFLQMTVNIHQALKIKWLSIILAKPFQ